MSEHSVVPLIRTFVAVVVALVLSGLATAPAGASTASTAPSADRAHHSRGPLDLEAGERAHQGATPRADARSGARTWRGRTLRYRETLPAKWEWSLSRAVASWNAAGASIRLVPTTSRARAQVTIGYGSTAGAAGLATVGRTARAYVHLNPSYDRVDALDSWNRVEVMGILAHELGHVLGFDHTSTRCALMAPVLDIAGCGEFDPDQPGWYRCRTLDTTLASRFVRLYGGRTRPAPTGSCLVDPMPSALAPAYRLDPGTDGVTVTWARPAVVPPGSQVEVRHWSAADCTQVPTDPSLDLVAPTSRTWQDPRGADEQDTCYVAVLANRYGVSRPARPVLLRPSVAAGLAAEDQRGTGATSAG